MEQTVNMEFLLLGKKRGGFVSDKGNHVPLISVKFKNIAFALIM